MRCTNKAAESASARFCADAEAETAATDVLSVAEATQPVSLGDAGARHEDTHVFPEYELGVSYSPDTEDGSVSKAALEVARHSGAHSGVGSPIDTTSQQGASTSVGTSQEEQELNVLRLAPEKKAWLPP
uniref:Uncharacterized protein n=1 Tax=Peronospora matthiolae TaxID=2874970 RepID=A0AAV1TCS1_9STRA